MTLTEIQAIEGFENAVGISPMPKGLNKVEFAPCNEQDDSCNIYRLYNSNSGARSGLFMRCSEQSRDSHTIVLVCEEQSNDKRITKEYLWDFETGDYHFGGEAQKSVSDEEPNLHFRFVTPLEGGTYVWDALNQCKVEIQHRINENHFIINNNCICSLLKMSFAIYHQVSFNESLPNVVAVQHYINGPWHILVGDKLKEVSDVTCCDNQFYKVGKYLFCKIGPEVWGKYEILPDTNGCKALRVGGDLFDCRKKDNCITYRENGYDRSILFTDLFFKKYKVKNTLEEDSKRFYELHGGGRTEMLDREIGMACPYSVECYFSSNYWGESTYMRSPGEYLPNICNVSNIFEMTVEDVTDDVYILRNKDFNVCHRVARRNQEWQKGDSFFVKIEGYYSLVNQNEHTTYTVVEEVEYQPEENIENPFKPDSKVREYKKDFSEIYDIARSINSFINTEGGKMYFGFSDTQEIIGLNDEYKTIVESDKVTSEGLKQYLLDFKTKLLEYIPEEVFDLLTIKVYETESKDDEANMIYAVLEIKHSQDPIFLKTSKIYVRNEQAMFAKLRGYEITKFVKDRLTSPADFSGDTESPESNDVITFEASFNEIVPVEAIDAGTESVNNGECPPTPATEPWFIPRERKELSDLPYRYICIDANGNISDQPKQNSEAICNIRWTTQADNHIVIFDNHGNVRKWRWSQNKREHISISTKNINGLMADDESFVLIKYETKNCGKYYKIVRIAAMNNNTICRPINIPDDEPQALVSIALLKLQVLHRNIQDLARGFVKRDQTTMNTINEAISHMDENGWIPVQREKLY